MKRFSEFCDETKPLEGDKVRLDDVVNIEMVVTGYKITKSKYNDNRCLHLAVSINGTKHVIFTGSTVLAEQVEKYGEHIPFLTRIIKNKRYYAFT